MGIPGDGIILSPYVVSSASRVEQVATWLDGEEKELKPKNGGKFKKNRPTLERDMATPKLYKNTLYILSFSLKY